MEKFRDENWYNINSRYQDVYDDSSKSWKKIGSLSSARSRVAVAAVYNNAIVVIGGCTKGGSMANLSSLTVMELGQAEQPH